MCIRHCRTVLFPDAMHTSTGTSTGNDLIASVYDILRRVANGSILQLHCTVRKQNEPNPSMRSLFYR